MAKKKDSGESGTARGGDILAKILFLFLYSDALAHTHRQERQKPNDTSIRLLKMAILVEKPEPLNTDTRTKD
ncbi:unnamed protein product [Dovyalis caffra]|uniref:Uncharacterized protein n=1 Tax=Dovyalis caffra TaxID=77055 RepID=A0AAV1RL82_9ROSI|nr:unnamed protein product [Dovyalis caffra]